MKKLALMLAAGAALAVAATVGYAAIPAANGVISACKDSKGSLKVIDAESGQTCNSNQQLLQWSQQGPAGANGVSGYEVVHAASQSNSLLEKSAVATCPAGKKPVGGGALVGTQSGNSWIAPDGVALNNSHSTGNGWGAVAREIVPTDQSWQIIAQAICVTAL